MSIVVKILDCIRTDWKHSDWKVRLNKVKTASALDNKKLHKIARDDENASVREEAVRKLHDPEYLSELAQHRRSLSFAYLCMLLLFVIFRAVPFPGELGGTVEPPVNNLSLEYIDDILSDLPFGNIAFNAPSTLNLGDASIVELLLSSESTVNELKQRLISVGQKEGYRIRIANDMQASLWGRGFQCKPIMPEEQVVSPSNATHWKWDVQAIKGGKQTLHLTISVNIYINQHATHYAIKTFEHNIDVQVTLRMQFASFISSYWLWIITVLLIPAIPWIIKQFAKWQLRVKSKALNKPTIILPDWQDDKNKP